MRPASARSFRMLDEARRRRERGQDVVVGAIQPQVPPDGRGPAGQAGSDSTQELRRRDCDGCRCDHPAASGRLLHRRSGLRQSAEPAESDPLAGRSGPCRRGIKVIGSINIQYIDELRQQVEAITGKHVTQTVPISFIKSADEIEIVDAPAERPLERIREEKEGAEIRAQRLSKLREMALVLAADVVEYQLAEYLKRHGVKQHFATQERILVCITPRANIQEMLRNGSDHRGQVSRRNRGRLCEAAQISPSRIRMRWTEKLAASQSGRRHRSNPGRRRCCRNASRIREIARHNATLHWPHPAVGPLVPHLGRPG